MMAGALMALSGVLFVVGLIATVSGANGPSTICVPESMAYVFVAAAILPTDTVVAIIRQRSGLPPRNRGNS